MLYIMSFVPCPAYYKETLVGLGTLFNCSGWYISICGLYTILKKEEINQPQLIKIDAKGSNSPLITIVNFDLKSNTVKGMICSAVGIGATIAGITFILQSLENK